MTERTRWRTFYCVRCERQVEGRFARGDSWPTLSEVFDDGGGVAGWIVLACLFVALPVIFPLLLLGAGLRGELRCTRCGTPQAPGSHVHKSAARKVVS